MSPRTRPGWSLVEVLVLIAIVACLIAILIPAALRIRYANTSMQCRNNLKQLMQAVQTYQSTSQQAGDAPLVRAERHYPPGCVGPDGPPEERLSWVVAVLPYLEQEALYRRFDMKAGYAGNLPAARTGIQTFLCPESSQTLADATTHYVAMAGIGADAAARPAGTDGNGFMGYDRPTSRAAIPDGLSYTIALMETRSTLGPWARGGTSTLRGFDPADVPWCCDGRPFGGHGDGTFVAMADGAVMFIALYNVDSNRLAAGITIAGGEKVALE